MTIILITHRTNFSSPNISTLSYLYEKKALIEEIEYAMIKIYNYLNIMTKNHQLQ